MLTYYSLWYDTLVVFLFCIETSTYARTILMDMGCGTYQQNKVREAGKFPYKISLLFLFESNDTTHGQNCQARSVDLARRC